jgi:hypothetical protein
MKPKCIARVHDRRAVLTGALRYAALGALAAAGGLTVAKRRRLVAEGKCINDGLCRGCAILARCDLPEALVTKQSAE